MAEKAGLLFMVEKVVKLVFQLFLLLNNGFSQFWLKICVNLVFFKVTDL